MIVYDPATLDELDQLPGDSDCWQGNHDYDYERPVGYRLVPCGDDDDRATHRACRCCGIREEL